MIHVTRRQRAAAVAGILAVAAVGVAHEAATASNEDDRPRGTVWVGNRGFPAVAAYDASTLEPLRTITLEAPASDVAVGRFGKVFVGEESINQIAVIDAATRERVGEIVTSGLRPHHLEASRNGRWITYGMYGSNKVGVIDARSGTLVGEWAASVSDAARSHASVITANGRTVYVANDSTNEVTAVDVRTGELLPWRVEIHHAHELVLTRDQRTMYVVGRMDNMLHEVDIARAAVVDHVEVGPMPDTLQLVDHDRMLTIGLRGNPAQLAIVDTETLEVVEPHITIAPVGTTLAGHQWTSPNGRWTLAAFEGGTTPGVALIDHRTGTITTAPFPGAGSRPHGLDVER